MTARLPRLYGIVTNNYLSDAEPSLGMYDLTVSWDARVFPSGVNIEVTPEVSVASEMTTVSGNLVTLHVTGSYALYWRYQEGGIHLNYPGDMELMYVPVPITDPGWKVVADPLPLTSRMTVIYSEQGGSYTSEDVFPITYMPVAP